MLEEKVFSGTSLQTLLGVINFLHVTRQDFTESHNMICDCDQILSLSLSGWCREQGDSFSGGCGKSKLHSVALHKAISIWSPGHGHMLDTIIFHDDEAWMVGENLEAREEHRKTRGKGWQERSGQSRQRQEERGNEAFLTPRTAWRQVIYKSNFGLTSKPWSIATLIDVSAAW